MDAQKLAQILSLSTSKPNRYNVLVQTICDPHPNNSPDYEGWDVHGTLVTIFLPDGSQFQLVLDEFSEVVDTYIAAPNAEESLWCEEGKLRFGGS